MKNKQLPLNDIRVIDFGQQITGPAVAMILADLGATVIHIDPPEGPQWKHSANAVLNRNKSCLTLDLKTGKGLSQALNLIDKADIVIENFRPHVFDRLGINFNDLREQRPELITLSIPGFSTDDELRKDWKATESIVAATAGAYTDMGFNRILMGINPSFSPLPLGSSYTTVMATTSLVLALLEREKTGRGDHIEVPAVAALMEGLSYNSYVVEGLPERYKTMRENEIERRRNNDIPMDINYDDLQEYLDPFYRSYICADDRMFYCVCPSHRNHAKRALKALDIYDELIEEGLPEVEDLHMPVDEWEGETSIGVYPLPKKWADRISAKMKKAFLKKTSSEWGDIFGQKGIPGAPHRTTKEWIHDEHTKTAGLIVDVKDPQYGVMQQPGPIVWMEGDVEQLLSPQPRREVSYDEALDILNSVLSQETVTRPTGKSIALKNQGKAWLKGVRILDLTNVIAGPHSAAFLSRFGAEVTKLDPVKPFYDPLIGTLFSFQSGVGKKSALVDINTDKGREIFEALIESSDIVLINAPERQMKPLGLDHDTLQAINPGVLFCRLDCFGGPLDGPKTDYIGYDDIIQANSGIMSRFGGEKTPEEHAHLGTLDVNCGFAAGLGMAVSLYLKQKTGQPSRARTSLSAITNLLQIPFALDYEEKQDSNEASGREALGNNFLSHFYQTQDSWIFLDSSLSELDKLDQIDGLKGIALAKDQIFFLTQAFKKYSSEQWVNSLQQANIAAAEPLSIQTLRNEYSRSADNTPGTDKGSFAFSVYKNHSSGHSLTQIDPYAIRPKESVIIAPSATERFGASTREVLGNIGYDGKEIDRMISENIASLGWGKEFLPS